MHYFDKNAFFSVFCPKYISDETYVHSSGDKTWTHEDRIK